jgi:hypothetical protein
MRHLVSNRDLELFSRERSSGLGPDDDLRPEHSRKRHARHALDFQGVQAGQDRSVLRIAAEVPPDSIHLSGTPDRAAKQHERQRCERAQHHAKSLTAVGGFEAPVSGQKQREEDKRSNHGKQAHRKHATRLPRSDVPPAA